MGGYNPNPPPDDIRPSTLQEADQQNVIRNANRARVGLSYWEKQPEQVQQQQQQQPAPPKYQSVRETQIHESGKPSWTPILIGADNERYSATTGAPIDPADKYALRNPVPDSYRAPGATPGIQETIASRPRYVAPGNLGDSKTQRRVNMMVAAGVSRDVALGRVLEQQRQEAYATPTLRDDRYFKDQLDLWNAQFIERSCGYHAYGMKVGTPIAANPYENVGDMALAFEKAGNVKENFARDYGFNRDVGEFMMTLPTDQMGSPVGLQEASWREAATGRQDRADYMPAVDYMATMMGRQGVYGNLAGGIKDVAKPVITKTVVPSTQIASTGVKTVYAGVVNVGGGFKTPFISTALGDTTVTTIAPTGEIPFLGRVPVVGDILAFFQPPTIRTTERGVPFVGETVSARMAGKEDFQYKLATSMDKLNEAPWVPSKGEIKIGKPVVSEPVAVGAPVITTRYNMETGRMETLSTQEYDRTSTQLVEQYDISKQVVTPITVSAVSGASGYEKINQQVRTTLNLPPPEKGERMVRYASLTNPFNVAPVVTSMITEKFNPKGAPAARAVEALVGLRGQYTQFYEQPLLVPASYATGAVFGAGWKTLQGGTNLMRVATAEKVISQGGIWRVAERGGTAAMKYAPWVLAGAYGVNVASRSTKGFTTFEPEYVVTKSKGLFIQEAVPMAMGFGMGGDIVSGAHKTAQLTRIDYLAMRQEAKAQNLANIPTTGRAALGEIKYTPADYASYRMQKFGAETYGRAAQFGEGAMITYVNAKVMAEPNLRITAANAMSEMYGAYYQALGYGKYAPLKPIASGKPVVPDYMQPVVPAATSPLPRIGTKTVGGRQVSGLTPERSLKSMGISDVAVSSGSGTKQTSFLTGRSVDYRGQPRGTMKPMKTTQSAMLYPQEQLPRVQPQEVANQVEFMHEVLPAFAIHPDTTLQNLHRVELSQVYREAQRQQFAQLQERYSDQTVLSVQKSGLFQEQMQDMFQTERQRYGLMSVQGFVQKVAQTPDQTVKQIVGQVPVQDQRRILDTMVLQDVIPMQTTRQLTRQVTKQLQDQMTWRDIVPKIVTPPAGIGGGGAGGWQSSIWERTYSFHEISPTLTPQEILGISMNPKKFYRLAGKGLVERLTPKSKAPAHRADPDYVASATDAVNEATGLGKMFYRTPAKREGTKILERRATATDVVELISGKRTSKPKKGSSSNKTGKWIRGLFG